MIALALNYMPVFNLLVALDLYKKLLCEAIKIENIFKKKSFRKV